MGIIGIEINGAVYPAEAEVNLGEFLAERGLLDRPCGGFGRCGKCRVVVSGAVNSPSDEERMILSPKELARGVRLACRTVIKGDCRVAPETRGESQICTDGVMPEVSLEPAFSAYGAAVDIGTTTLAARLYDTRGELLAEASAPNPQAAWGADVISRMEAAVGGAAELLRSAVCGAVDALLTEMATAAGIAADAVDGLVLTGNTVMLYLLTGTSVEPLTRAPFTLTRRFGETVTAGKLALTAVKPDTAVFLPPVAAAFIGADVVTALLVAELHDGEMMADIGTNSEMVLRVDDRLLCCSAAAGPAFEGAGISMGMSGQVGAVDRIRLQARTLVPHVIGDNPPKGICGSGLVDAIACLLLTHRMDRTGLLKNDPTVIAPPVVLTQADIRAVQLAKSAIHAGMRALLHAAGETATGVSLCVAGGFGQYLNVQHAGYIGLLPAEMAAGARVLGNAALSGASVLLLNGDYRSICRRMVEYMEIVELSTDPVFAEEYIKQMDF